MTPRQRAARFRKPTPVPARLRRPEPVGNRFSDVLLVGESPGPASDPFEPLDPRRSQGAAGRLARLLGQTPEEFERAYDRINVFQTREEFEARNPIPSYLLRPLSLYPVVIALGRTAAKAIGLPPGYEWCVWYPSGDGFGGKRGAIPHPSGLNRWYNDEEAAERVREFVLGVLP